MQHYVITHFVNALFTADGDTGALGVISVSTANGALLWPGARVVVGSTQEPAVEAVILEDLGGGKFRVRLEDQGVGNYASGNPQPASTDKALSPRAVPTPKGGSSWAAYKVADAAFIMQPQDQFIFNYTRDGIVPRVPSAIQGQ
jgi:hypothetical protein